MTVLMPTTQQPMSGDEQNVVAVLLNQPTGLRREEIARYLASPRSSAASTVAAIAALVAGGAVAPAGTRAAMTGEFGR
jgi:hypothetical protein